MPQKCICAYNVKAEDSFQKSSHSFSNFPKIMNRFDSSYQGNKKYFLCNSQNYQNEMHMELENLENRENHQNSKQLV